jgi:hypothetical protein
MSTQLLTRIHKQRKTMEVSWNQIVKTWRKTFVNKLEERYGLGGEEARKKADAWLQWLRNQPNAQPQTQAAARIRDRRVPSRTLVGKSRSRAATQ